MRTCAIVVSLLLTTAGAAPAAPEPDTPLPGKLATVRTTSSLLTNEVRFECRPIASTLDLPADPANFPNTAGAHVRMRDTGWPPADVTISIPPGAGWSTPLWGYLYNAPAAPGTCRYLKIREYGATAGVKGRCHRAAVLTTPFMDTLAIEVHLGPGPSPNFKRYCCVLGGTHVRNDLALLKRRDAPAPPACP